MAKRKVLMLGWEFPPLINGGLGIACYGIAKALSKKSDLTVILPKSSQDTYLEDVSILGLNNIDVEGRLSYHSEYDKLIKKYNAFSNLHMVETAGGVSPYPDNEHLMGSVEFSSSETYEETGISKKRYSKRGEHVFMGRFILNEMYGEDVLQKVVEYADFVAALASNLEFDVIHAHDWMTILAGLKVKYETGKPLVLHAHALSYDRSGPDSRGWIYELEKHGLENADAIIPVSYYTGRIVRDHYNIDPRKIFPVHNGIEPVEAFKKEKDFPEKLVLFLGRITGQKGPEFFLDVASKVLSENNNVRFVMAGNGDQFKRIIETGAYRKVGNKFHFTGFLNREKVNQLLAMADVYCMPSVSEPFGLSAVEAAQFGIPAVISKQSGAAEVLKHALVADFWDVELMAKHINDLLTDDELRASVIANTYKDIETVTWDMAADGIMETYTSVIGDGHIMDAPIIDEIEKVSTASQNSDLSGQAGMDHNDKSQAYTPPPAKNGRPMTIPEMILEMERIMKVIDGNNDSIKNHSKGIKKDRLTLEKNATQIEKVKQKLEESQDVLSKNSSEISTKSETIETLSVSIGKTEQSISQSSKWLKTKTSKKEVLKTKKKSNSQKNKITADKKSVKQTKTTKKGKTKSVKEDLTKIEGVGSKIAKLLKNAGIITFKDLANAKVKQLKGILSDAGNRFKMHDPSSWPGQAKLAAKGKWKELKKWQDEN